MAFDIEFQFTPLREGRRVRLRATCAGMQISIHAPPRGATLTTEGNPVALNISIHAPPRGATPDTTSSRRKATFQFTPLREGRPAAAAASSACHSISIHAPPRGATSGRRVQRLPFHFNSRPSARGDQAPTPQLGGITIFQFTPLREGRHFDLDIPEIHFPISIHAPPRGATPPPTGKRSKRRDFNSRPSARGDTPQLSEDAKADIISIHAPPRGATRWILPSTPTPRYFNSRPSARGDL